MKSYNVDNYVRYKADVKKTIHSIGLKNWDEYTRDELICIFLPLVENIARKFSTSQQASGVMDITDLIQEGSIALIKSIDNIDLKRIMSSDEPEKTIKSFLSKRIKGSIRRAIDINRGTAKIPEYKLNELRRNIGDEKLMEMFLSSMFLSIDEYRFSDDDEGENFFDNIVDNSEPYKIDEFNKFLMSSMQKILGVGTVEYDVLRLSYGLDCDRCSAVEIAKTLNIDSPSYFVRISEIKKRAISKLSANLSYSQVIDLL